MLVNLTPHPIVFEGGRTLPKCDNPPRLAETCEEIGDVDGIPLIRKMFDVNGCDLPGQASRTVYIVPLLIAQVFSDRDDLVIPNDPIRDESGRITGCRSLAIV